jgi:hypothetical protein
MNRNATFKLTECDIEAVKAATLDDDQGMLRNDGSP